MRIECLKMVSGDIIDEEFEYSVKIFYTYDIKILQPRYECIFYEREDLFLCK